MGIAMNLNQVTKEFKGKKAVDNVSFQIEEGSVVALLGPNGAGKTTTISMALGLLRPTSGTVRLLGANAAEDAVRDRLGAMLQDISIIDGLKVAETIDLFRSYYTKPLPLNQLLRLSGLEAEKNKFASSLSGGQKRRLGFALALAGDPSILFLDEPTVGMDIGSRQLFWETVRVMAGRGRTIILTTHYLDEADNVADRVIVIDKGKLAADGTPAAIKAQTTGRTIEFTAGSGVTSERLQQLPGVKSITWNGRRVKLSSSDTDRLLTALVALRLEMKDIEVRSGGLEEAFQQLVQQRQDETGSIQGGQS